MKYDLNISTLTSDTGLDTGMYPVVIYQLIRQYSSVDNKISVNDIEDTLMDYWKGDKDKESSKKNLRRTIKRNLKNLLYFDSNIHAEDKNGDECPVEDEEFSNIKKLWYDQEISPGDLQLLSDAVVYSRHLTNKDRQRVLKHLMNAAGLPNMQKNQWFTRVIEDSKDISIKTDVKLFHRLEHINQAIIDKHTISFDYCLYGPDNIKMKVKSYENVSPYKIIHNDGIYYLVAARQKHPEFTYDKYEKAENVIYVALHKMEKLKIADNSDKYIPIEETIANEKTLGELLGNGFHPYNLFAIPFRFKEDIYMGASILGLDALNDRFGNRMKVITRKDYTAKKAKTGEVPHPYEIVIKDVARNDWYDIIILLLQYPANELALTGDSKRLLEAEIMKISFRLKQY